MMRSMLAMLFVTAVAQAQTPKPGDFTLKDFRFNSGETLPEVRMHYRTYGSPRRDDKGMVNNAILVLHGTGGEGGTFVRSMFAGELFAPLKPLDAANHFIIIPDNLGHGRSSRPSDGMKGRFPKYGYRDMIAAQHRLLTEGLGVNHLKLVMGTSMGGMHTWLWGETYPDFMDGLIPLASLPTQISGRNRIWRRIAIDAITNDPEWRNGDYTTQPRGLRTAAQMLTFMSGNPLMAQKQGPTLAKADAMLDKSVADRLKTIDANNTLYAISASWDYDPGPKLEKIVAPLLAINFADDLINPPELGILEREIKRVPRGKAVVIPLSEETVGHGTHTKAVIWKPYLERFLGELGE